jgi:hypothetical protein
MTSQAVIKNPIDFDKDVREFVLETLPYAADARAELEAETTSGMLIAYFNWYCRLVPAQRRRVHKSLALKHKIKDLPTSQRRALQKIEDDISRGRDLSPHLSRSIKTGYLSSKRASKQGKTRRDRDLMLYDWGLHHLHLSDQLDGDGFVTRTEDLLFAGFLHDDAYLIDIAPHGSWYLKSLLETIVVSWPNSGLLLPSLSGLRLATTFTDDEGLELREAGVTANMFEFEDKVWMPRDGISTARTSIRATRRADLVLTEAERLEALVRTEPKPILDEIRQAAPDEITEPSLRFLIDGHSFGIFEESSRVFLVFGRLSE